jgi:hypothetical protein
VFLEEINPLLFSDEKGLAIGDCGVDKLGRLFEAHVVGSQHVMMFVFKLIHFLAVDLESDLVSAFWEKKNLIDLVKLVNNNCSSKLKSGLQILQQIHHKIAVNKIIPSIKRIFIIILEIFNAKQFRKRFKPILKQKVTININLHLVR